jgi:hypothetical protein
MKSSVTAACRPPSPLREETRCILSDTLSRHEEYEEKEEEEEKEVGEGEVFDEELNYYLYIYIYIERERDGGREEKR